METLLHAMAPTGGLGSMSAGFCAAFLALECYGCIREQEVGLMRGSWGMEVWD